MRASSGRGRAVAALAAVLHLGWSSVAGAAVETFAYAPPTREPKGERTRYVDEQPDIVLQAIWTFFEEQGLSIETIDPKQRLVIARYHGDPRPYLDCGRVELEIDGKAAKPPRVYSANKPEIRTSRTVGNRRYGLLRRLILDARLVVRVEPRGKGARVFSSATFVASLQLERLRKGGVPDELVRREVVSFQSDEVGRFDKGTRCVSNGKLEGLPLTRFPRSS